MCRVLDISIPATITVDQPFNAMAVAKGSPKIIPFGRPRGLGTGSSTAASDGRETNGGTHCLMAQWRRGEGCVCAGAHATALGRETVRLHVARLRVALLPVRRAVPALSLALGRQAVRLRRVRQAVLAVRPLGEARARTPQADGRQTQAVADAVTRNQGRVPFAVCPHRLRSTITTTTMCILRQFYFFY